MKAPSRTVRAMLLRMMATLVPLMALLGCEPDSSLGTLVDFVSLGTGAIGSHSVELTADAGKALLTELTDGEANHLDEAEEALTLLPDKGERAFAFVLPGCAETSAELLNTNGTLTAELTGGDGTDCAQAVYFLATFRVPASLITGATVR